jgi:thiol-disulfide isomerase/thioredoxin
MTPKRLLLSSCALVVLALLVVGLVQLAGGAQHGVATSKLSAAQIDTRLARSPAPLSALHTQADEVLPGGARALRDRLGTLHGYPLVINKWASWCTPCRAERGAFQHASATFGRTVAFLGIYSGDTSVADALSFLRAFPVGYPSYYDQSGAAGQAVTDSSFTPVTVFFDHSGGEYIHQGPYLSLASLERDIRRYALEG